MEESVKVLSDLLRDGTTGTIEMIKNSAPFVWEATQRSVVVNALLGIVAPTVIMIVSGIIFFKADKTPGNDTVAGLSLIALGISIVLFLLFATCGIHDLYALDYATMEKIITLISHIK